MTREQINTLRQMLTRYRMVQGEQKQDALTQLLSYLGGALDGIEDHSQIYDNTK